MLAFTRLDDGLLHASYSLSSCSLQAIPVTNTSRKTPSVASPSEIFRAPLLRTCFASSHHQENGLLTAKRSSMVSGTSPASPGCHTPHRVRLSRGGSSHRPDSTGHTMPSNGGVYSRSGSCRSRSLLFGGRRVKSTLCLYAFGAPWQVRGLTPASSRNLKSNFIRNVGYPWQ